MSTPRLRMFAGPNGSGKSTIKEVLPAALLGVYINPDEIEKQIRESGYLDLSGYLVESTTEEVQEFFGKSPLLERGRFLGEVAKLTLSNGRLHFHEIEVNSYFASVCSDFLRHKLLEQKISFSFETVMSSRDKVEFLKKAQEHGYRTYLYYVATEDPAINLNRVQNRVRLGGHGVPEDKILQRYDRSLDLLLDAIRLTNRAYLFDNSRDGEDHLWVAEITEGKLLETRCEPVPAWFQRAVLHKISGQTPFHD